MRLEGEIEQFAEVDEKDGRKAVLSVYVTLLDSSQKDASKMIVCQKNYRVTEPYTGKGPAAFAEGHEQGHGKVLTTAYSGSAPWHLLAVKRITRPVAGRAEMKPLRLSGHGLSC